MKKIEAYVKPHKLSDVVMALQKVKEFSGMSVTDVRGFGRRGPTPSTPRTRIDDLIDFSPYAKVEIFCGDEAAEEIVGVITHSARTGLRGDGKIYVSSVEKVVRIMNGVKGEQAI
jgi:nitrogen regulatory protein P-II 1